MKIIEQVRGGTSIPQNLSWLPLTPDEFKEQIAYYARKRPNVKRWYIDTRLASAFDVINEQTKRGKGGKMFPQEELSASLKDRNFTKFQTDWDETRQQLDKFADPTHDRPDSRWRKDFKVAVSLVEEAIKPMGQLVPYQITDPVSCEKVFGDASTSAGFGGRGSKRDNINHIYDAFKALKSRVANDASLPADEWAKDMYVLFHRTQLSGYISEDGMHYEPDSDVKHRAVLGGSGGPTAFNGQYAKPTIAYLKDNWWNYSGGDDPDTMRSKIRIALAKSRYWLQTDISRFDQSLPSWLMFQAYDIVKALFPKRYHHEIAWCANDMVHSQILLPGGDVFVKHRGITSGSYFTQVIGSICNALMILTYLCSTVPGSPKEKAHEVRNMLGKRRSFDPLLFLVLGDDSLIFTDRPINVRAMARYLWKIFGVKVSPEKSTSSREHKWPCYLKREWRANGEWRNPLDLVIALTHPEYERKYDGYTEWHIIYALRLTYKEAFPKALPDIWFLKKMQENGGISALVKMEFKDLPGPLKGYGDSGRIRNYLEAEAKLGLQQSA